MKWKSCQFLVQCMNGSHAHHEHSWFNNLITNINEVNSLRIEMWVETNE